MPELRQGLRGNTRPLELKNSGPSRNRYSIEPSLPSGKVGIVIVTFMDEDTKML